MNIFSLLRGEQIKNITLKQMIDAWLFEEGLTVYPKTPSPWLKQLKEQLEILYQSNRIK
jgi:hypothetical protein